MLSTMVSRTCGQTGRGRSWPMPSIWHELRAGDGFRRRLATARRHQRIVDAVDDERSERSRRRGRAVRSLDAMMATSCARNPGRRDRGSMPRLRERAVRSTSIGKPLPPITRATSTDMSAASSTFWGRATGQHRHGLGTRLSDARVTSGRHDRTQRQRLVGMLDRERLRDHPAHRRADDVSRADVERVEQTRRRRPPCRSACTTPTDVSPCRAAAIDVRRRSAPSKLGATGRRRGCRSG